MSARSQAVHLVGQREKRRRRQTACEKTAFLSHLYIKTNILPRQARDKHRENSKKMPFFLGFLAMDQQGVFEVRKRSFQSHLCVNAFALPRQARDEHRT
jgi:hypothetical protein